MSFFQKCTVVWEVCAGYTACNLRFYISFVFVLWIQDKVLKVKTNEWPSTCIQYPLCTVLHQHSTSWGKQKCENKSTKVKDSYRIHQKKEKEKKSMLSKNIPILSCWMAPNSRVQQDCTGYTVITIVCTSFTFCIIAFPGKPSRSPCWRRR